MRGCTIRIKSALSGAQLGKWFSAWIDNPNMIEHGAKKNIRETPGSHDMGVTWPP